MPKEQRFEIRDLRDGNWYWIHKSVIKEYAREIGAIGIAVYSFLAVMADSDQSCFPSQKYIGDKLGYSRATVNKALKRLEMNGLIIVSRTNRYHCVYHLLKVRCKAGETQVSNIGNSGVIYFDTNDNNITRNNNDIDNDDKKMKKYEKEFIPRTREELLAYDLSQALNDRNGLALYLSYSKRFPESLLRRTLGEVMEIPLGDDKEEQSGIIQLFNKQA